MEHANTPTLTLTIANASAVPTTPEPACTFGVQGGSIGSASSDTWRLSAQGTGVMPGHAEVRWADGAFCLIDRSGRTYINSASEPVGRGRRARLQQGDEIRLGGYRLRADMNGRVAQSWSAPTDDETSMLPPVGDETGLLRSGPAAERDGGEPLGRLQPAPGQPEDPLPDWCPHPGVGAVAEREGDAYREARDGVMELPVIGRQRSAEGANRVCDRRNEGAAVDNSRQHLSGAPLLRGLGVEIGFEDTEAMSLFLEEAGATLKATLEGLLALHQGEDRRHRALRTRWQPIEDNPLRLGQDYAHTVQPLFAGQRSPVHLSAPAAVRESLASLDCHQQATQAAIREALDAVLHAFSPQALLRRFHGYRRGLRAGEDEGRWAWDMYQHYYEELKSRRQQGFERLFQEVFDQAYDQHMRQLQRENLS